MFVSLAFADLDISTWGRPKSRGDRPTSLDVRRGGGVTSRGKRGEEVVMHSYRRMVRHLWLVLALIPLPAWGGAAFIYVTNSAGDSIHVIDPATNKVVQEIKGIEAAHGIAPSPDGSRVYVSNEADSTLDVFDRESGALLKKVPLSNHPNNIAVT